MNLTELAFKNKAVLYFLIFVIIVGGVFSFINMSKLEDPELKVKQALVITLYPGATAHEVEMQVTDPLEKSLNTMGKLDNISSRSLANYSEIKVELGKTVGNEEVEQLWDSLRRKVSDIQNSLPSGAQTSLVFDDFGDVYGMFYAMTSDDYTYEEMSDYAELLKRELLSLDDVKRVSIYGNQSPCINIEVSRQDMARLGVLPIEVLNTINSQNESVYSGSYESGDSRIRVAVNDTYKSIDDIENLIIQGHENDQMKLKDIAKVTRGYKEPFRNELRYNKKQALGISIAMQSGGNIINLGQAVDDKISSLKTRIPEGIEFEKVFFQPEKVDIAINNFMINLIESVAIVILILMFVMGLRSGILIGYSLVLTILSTFVILFMLDGTLQRVSLGAFIVAMGMLVDNAIVVVDGIINDLEKGLNRKEALVRTAKKTAFPLLGATLIAIFAFLPIFLSPDTTGEYIKDLFIVLAVSLLMSWILALTQTPISSEKFLKVKVKAKDAKESLTKKAIRKTIVWSVNHKTLMIALTIILLIASFFGFKQIKQGFFPDLSYNQVYVEFKMPEGTKSETIKAKLAEIEDNFLAREEITNITTSIGGTPSRYNLVRSIAENSMSYGELIVDFTDAETLKKMIPELQEYLNTNYPEAFSRIKRYNLMYKKFPIEAMFTGPDPAVLRDLASQAQEIMDKNDKTILVTNDWEPQTPYLLVDYYQATARRSGISRSDLGTSILAATDGIPIGKMYEGNTSLPIMIKSIESDGSKIEDLNNFPVWSAFPLHLPDKTTIQNMVMDQNIDLSEFYGSIPLSQVTKGIYTKWEEPVIRRYNSQRAIKAQCNNASGYNATEALNAIKADVEAINLPAGYELAWQGEYQASNNSKKYLFLNLPLAVVLMLSMLIILFKDFKKPIIIISSLPLILIGITAGMLLTGKEFGFTAIVGALGLLGMMIKNGVVLLDEIGEEINNGKDAYNAVVDSAVSRTRPVMMASLTTILGMVPLVPDDMFGGLAVTIMGGLLVGTLIVLIFIPVMYCILFNVKAKKGE